MPELPEVETIVRTLRPQIAHRAITAVHVLLPKALAAGEALLPEIVSARIRAVRRRAKLLLLDLDAPGAPEASETPGPTHCLAFHLKMTGALFVYDATAEPGKHTRLIFDLAPETTGDKEVPASRLFFDDVRTFGYCRLMRPEAFASWPFWTKLGPEPLSLTPEAFSRALGNRKGSVKSLLLDQTVVAGIGNIYADEACFRSGIHPATPADRLSEDARATLLRTVQEVLNESIRECGSSIRNYRDANGDAGAFQNSFRVYGRAGQPCRTCGAALQKTTLAARATVFCPHCQRSA